MEMVDLYDENRLPLGRTAERYAPKGEGEYRVVVHICVFDSRGRLLIQQRSREKAVWPEAWDVSAAGGVDAGETSRQAAEQAAALLQAEIVKKRRWATDEELLDLYSIGQCTPGIISVNVATFMGYRQAGIAGACAATLGMVMPSLIIITLLAAVLDRYMHNRYVSYAFTGIRICVVALILDIIYDLWKKGITDYKGAGIFAGALLLLLGFNLSAVWIVILAGIAGLGLKGAAGK